MDDHLKSVVDRPLQRYPSLTFLHVSTWVCILRALPPFTEMFPGTRTDQVRIRLKVSAWFGLVYISC